MDEQITRYIYNVIQWMKWYSCQFHFHSIQTIRCSHVCVQVPMLQSGSRYSLLQTHLCGLLGSIKHLELTRYGLNDFEDHDITSLMNAIRDGQKERQLDSITLSLIGGTKTPIRRGEERGCTLRGGVGGETADCSGVKISRIEVNSADLDEHRHDFLKKPVRLAERFIDACSASVLREIAFVKLSGSYDYEQNTGS
jgi:hypothetical protein